MSNPTFTYTPDFDASKSVRPRVGRSKFGDGYEQRVTSGLNTKPAVWGVDFLRRPTSEIDTVEAFLAGQGGVDYFYWTPPDEATPIKVICSEWNATKPHAGMRSLSATFEQVFDL